MCDRVRPPASWRVGPGLVKWSGVSSVALSVVDRLLLFVASAPPASGVGPFPARQKYRVTLPVARRARRRTLAAEGLAVRESSHSLSADWLMRHVGREKPLLTFTALSSPRWIAARIPSGLPSRSWAWTSATVK